MGVNAYLQLISRNLHSLQLKISTFPIESACPLQSEKRLKVGDWGFGLVKNCPWILHVALFLVTFSKPFLTLEKSSISAGMNV